MYYWVTFWTIAEWPFEIIPTYIVTPWSAACYWSKGHPVHFVITPVPMFLTHDGRGAIVFEKAPKYYGDLLMELSSKAFHSILWHANIINSLCNFVLLECTSVLFYKLTWQAVLDVAPLYVVPTSLGLGLGDFQLDVDLSDPWYLKKMCVMHIFFLFWGLHAGLELVPFFKVYSLNIIQSHFWFTEILVSIGS